MERYGRSFRDEGCSRAGEAISPGLLGGLIFSPRLYNCGFCKRVFKSAQALGGHMNVHRRDRARLRQYSPPWDPVPLSNPNPNPNPNPIPGPEACPNPHTVLNLNRSPPPCTNVAKCSIPSLISPRTCFAVTSTTVSSSPIISPPAPPLSRGDEFKSTKHGKALFEVKRLKGFIEAEKVVMTSEKGQVGLDVEKDLDLELRLWYT